MEVAMARSATAAPEEALVRYDTTTIVLHWLTALLVGLLWILGQTNDWWPRGPLRGGLWSLHVLLGFALMATLATRVVWRIGPGRALPSAEDGPLRLLARATHSGLYLLLIAVVGLGLADALVRGFVLFGAIPLPQVGDQALRRPINALHEWAANAVMAVAGLHAAAGLFHHYVRQDGVLGRMWRAS
ncbi:cytochrome B561 [Methylobacterium sp. 4-46]|uniref:cytochrome b n=1 Tax=unclassified Methylobacterium TaxID=2615210 RepID=UPI000152D236|nr:MULTISPECIES: cytochrome b [Methylobacterium]ACA15053.1 cytochrome B561 [Methylobacterium sp. 4-46]WFT80791.1 cytochrome b [Methylobacterium nodulans]